MLVVLFYDNWHSLKRELYLTCFYYLDLPVIGAAHNPLGVEPDAPDQLLVTLKSKIELKGKR